MFFVLVIILHGAYIIHVLHVNYESFQFKPLFLFGLGLFWLTYLYFCTDLFFDIVRSLIFFTNIIDESFVLLLVLLMYYVFRHAVALKVVILRVLG